MPLITLGDDTKLKLKVPSKGDTGWESDFKTEFAQKIVDHDHTGVDGKGAKISEAAIEDGAITTDKIADGAITSVKIAADAVADIDLAPDSVGTSELKNDAVETANILDANVTEAKLATDSVSTNKIVDANVTTAKIADANVTAAKIGSDVVLSTLNDVSSATPSAGQVLKWDGVANEWAPGADSGGSGGADVDTISSASDASNYTGTARFINITSTVDVTFTSDLSDRIINIANNITVNFTVDNLENCIIKGETATVIVESPYQPDIDNAGGSTIIQNCDIRAYTVRFLVGGYSLNPGSSHTGTSIYIYNSTIYSRWGSASDATFGTNFSSITNFMMWFGTPSIYFYNSLFSNHTGTILSKLRVYLSEARIYQGQTDNSLSAYGLSGSFYATTGPILIVVSRTSASFTNTYSMTTGTTTSQHFFG